MTAHDVIQQEVFRFLADPKTHGASAVRRIDTHAAAVFLAGDRALKVKRAVHYCFLDFTTLESRKAACEAELEVNRRLAPMIYRRVVPITREANGGLALDGGGAPIEWAVEMRRFDEEFTLDRLAAGGRLDGALADALGRAVAAAHADPQAAPAAPPEWIDALARYIEEQAQGFAQNPELFPSAEAERLAASSRAAHARVRPLLARRGEQGFITRIHGDLHLGNIVLIEGRPVLFDAIEFNPLIATGDLLYDLGFLLMDLIKCGLRPLANVVLNRYLADARRRENLDALDALPLFMSIRAQIRANVSAARLAFVEPAQREETITAAHAYFRLAQELIAPPAPALIAIGGLSGTGKSALARALAPEIPPAPGAVVLRSDAERKAMFGVAETERLPTEAYSPDVTRRVYGALADMAQRAAAAGHSAIVDAVFARPQERAMFAALGRSNKVAFRGLFLTADLATRMARVQHRPPDASDADISIARQQETYDLGAMDWTPIDASGAPQETLARAREALSRDLP